MGSYQKLKFENDRLRSKQAETLAHLYEIMDGNQKTIEVYKSLRAFKKGQEHSVLFGGRKENYALIMGGIKQYMKEN
jgi:hypothetical protein